MAFLPLKYRRFKTVVKMLQASVLEALSFLVSCGGLTSCVTRSSFWSEVIGDRF
jgi:hypothetical protein